MISWHPGVDWTADDVFACHSRYGLPLHEAYTHYGATRLSCAFCILASRHDLSAATDAADNLNLYLHLVEMEATSTFSFQPQRWRADVAPHLLPSSLARDIVRARGDAAERRRLEAGMPAGLRFVKGWPPRCPTVVEAGRIAAARAPIVGRHGVKNHFPSGPAVVARFSELLAAKAQRAS